MQIAHKGRMWIRLTVLVLAPYLAILPLILAPHRPVTAEFLPKRSPTHPCDGTSSKVELLKRPRSDLPATELSRRGWRRIESELVVLESNLSAAEMQGLVAAVLVGRRALEETFGLDIRSPVRLRIFETVDQFRAEAEKKGRSHAESCWDMDQDEIVLPRVSAAQAIGQILHWLVHRATRGQPEWLAEGLAELASGAAVDGPAARFDLNRPDWLQEAQGMSRALRLCDVPALKQVRTREERARAGMLLHLLIRRYGPWPVRLLLQGARPQDLPRWSNLEQDEREYLKSMEGKEGRAGSRKR